jgi:AcrR family transcriptional regulator
MHNALLELISEKGYKKISITDITDRAGLSRPTFYLHYKSKDDILMDHLDTLFAPVLEELNVLRQDSDIDQPGAIAMTRLFERIFRNIDVFRVVLQAGVEQSLIKRLYQHNLIYLIDLADRCEMEIKKEVLELAAQYLAGALVGIIVKWIQSSEPQPPNKMGVFLTEISMPIIRTVVCNGELDYIFTALD